MKNNRIFKNVLVLVIIILGGTLSASAQDLGDPIDFSVGWGDPDPIEPGNGKGSVLMPTVWQDGYLLDFHSTHDAYVLRIVDATNTVVYSTIVPSYQTQVWLPTYLVGTYELQLYNGEAYYFYSEIELE